MLNIVTLIYLWLTIFIIIRYQYLSNQCKKKAKYKLEFPLTKTQESLLWLSTAVFICCWPILLLLYRSDFVGAFIYNKTCSFNSLLFRIGRVTGITVGVIIRLFK